MEDHRYSVRLAALAAFALATSVLPLPSRAASQPPRLLATATFEDPGSEGALVAELGGTVVFRVTNTGRGPARSVTVRLLPAAAIAALGIPDSAPVGDLAPGEARDVRVPISARADLAAGHAIITAEIVDRDGFDARPLRLDIETIALRLPQLAVEQAGARESGAPDARRLKKGVPITLDVVVRNTGPGAARNASAILQSSDPAVMVLKQIKQGLGDIEPGGWAGGKYEILVNHGYKGPAEGGPATLPLTVKLAEAHPQVAHDEAVPIVLDAMANRVNPVEFKRTAPEAGVTFVAADSLAVDVDQPLERRRAPDPDALAVVIGIESYQDRAIPDVSFAERDAAMVREYFEKVLGVAPENIWALTNERATKGNFENVFEGELSNRVKRGRSDVYVYFAGHGAPDPESKSAYLVTWDSNPQFARKSGYGLERLYGALGDLKARSVTVALDSCFSGQVGRGQEVKSLLAARPLLLDLKSPAVPVSVTVLAATGPDQVSSGFDAKRHGLFTYYFLKGLRGEAATGGKVTVGALASYVAAEVPSHAKRIGRTQTPVLYGAGAARTLAEW